MAAGVLFCRKDRVSVQQHIVPEMVAQLLGVVAVVAIALPFLVPGVALPLRLQVGRQLAALRPEIADQGASTPGTVSGWSPGE